MNKIQDIKKKKAQHIDVHQDAVESSHISVHRDASDNSKIETTNMEPDTSSKNSASEKNDSPPITVSKKKTAALDDVNTMAEEKNKNHAAQTKTHPIIDKPKEMKPANVIFMGTGFFAANILENLLHNDHCILKEIITQPDKKIGRKKSTIHRTLAANPVRDIAVSQNITLFQPAKIDADAVVHIKKIKPDVIIVASYGKILPQELLNIPMFGAINVHASLLPQLRGASPAQNALLLGLKETGVTIMQMDHGLDTGDIIVQEKTPIEDHEKADELLEKLSEIGARLLNEILPKILQKDIHPTKQDATQATLCQLIDREDGHIQWTDSTEDIYNRYRALYPWPGVFSYWEEKENQMMRIKLRAINPYKEELTDEEKEFRPGTVFIGHDQLCIKTFDTAIIIEAVQPECKAVMPVYDFLNGHNEFEGSVLV